MTVFLAIRPASLANCRIHAMDGPFGDGAAPESFRCSGPGPLERLYWNETHDTH